MIILSSNSLIRARRTVAKVAEISKGIHPDADRAFAIVLGIMGEMAHAQDQESAAPAPAPAPEKEENHQYTLGERMEMTKEQREALGWILDLAYDDQQTYLHFGAPHRDYGDEWPAVAAQKAAYCRTIAEMAGINGEHERWESLAGQFEIDATDAEKGNLIP